MARTVDVLRRPPLVKPAPGPSPAPATEIWPRTKRSPPSMKRTMRSLIAPRATSPATPMAMPATVNAYPRSARTKTRPTTILRSFHRSPRRSRAPRRALLFFGHLTACLGARARLGSHDHSSVISPLTSAPRARLGSHDHLRSSHRSPRRSRAPRLARPLFGHLTAHLGASRAPRLARPLFGHLTAHLGASRAPRLALPFEPRRDGQAGATTNPDVDADEREQQREGSPGAPGHADEGAAREDGEHRVVHAEVVTRAHEEVQERGLVVLVDEAEERRRPAAHAALVGGEAPRVEAPVPERRQDRLRGELAGPHGDIDPAREDRIDEGDGVAHGHEVVADRGHVVVREVRLAMDGSDLLAACELLGDGMPALDPVFVQLLERPRPGLNRPFVYDGTDARQVTGERDPPAPAIVERIDSDVALFLAGKPLGATEVGEERDLAQVRDAPPASEPRGEKALAAAGVDHHGRTRRHEPAVGAGRHRHAIRIEHRRLDRGRLEHRHPVAPCVVEQDRVELGARHLVGVIRPWLTGEEVEGLRRLLIGERGPILDLKAPRLDGVAGAELLQQEHDRRHQRLADVEARKALALEETDA